MDFCLNPAGKFFIVILLLLNPFLGKPQSPKDARIDFLLGKIDALMYVNTDSVNYYAHQLLDLAIATNDSVMMASAYQSIGYAYYYQNELDKTLSYFEKAKEILDELEIPIETGLLYMDFGNLYGEMGYFEKALTFYEKAEEVLKEHSPYPEDLAIVYYNLGHTFMDINDIHNLKKYIGKTAEIVEGYEIYYLLPAVQNMEAYVAIQEKNYAKARALSEEALAGSTNEKDLVEQVFALENLGLIEMAGGNATHAIAYLDSSLTIARQYGDQNIVISQKAMLASFHLENGNLALADSLASSAYRQGKAFNSLLITKRTSSVYADVLEQKGEHQTALEIYKIYTKAKDSINSFEVSEKLLRSQNRISTQQNQLLKAEATLLKANNTRNKILILATSVALVLSVVIIILMVLNLGARKKAARELRIKQKTIDEKSKELEQKNIQLERMNNGKDKLFSIITHDMKEPFNQITSFIHILEHTTELDPSMKELIAKIKESTRSTLFAMNNLLMWSKSQFMNLQTQAEEVDMRSVVNSVEAELTTTIKDKLLVLHTMIGENTTLIADRHHVEIILRNLLSNAIKFSPKGGVVDLTVQRTLDGIEIAVRDNGKGMTREEVDNIFDTQKHFSTPGTLNEKGTGLGMLIVSEFVKENKGTIEIDSEKNKGSTFKVILPAA